MWIFGIVLLEAAFAGAVIYGFAFWDAQLKAWEDRQIARLRAGWRQLQRRLHWATRRIRRSVCARWLAVDGLTVTPMRAEDVITVYDSADEVYAEVLQLIGK